jgi:hypothetical protein
VLIKNQCVMKLYKEHGLKNLLLLDSSLDENLHIPVWVCAVTGVGVRHWKDGTACFLKGSVKNCALQHAKNQAFGVSR